MGPEDGVAPSRTDQAGNGEDRCTMAESQKQSSFRERWRNADYRGKVWRTVWLGATFWGLGFAVGQRGPSFLDIQIVTGTNVEHASFFFTSAALGYLVGALAAGVIYDLLNKSLLFLSCVVGMAASTIAIPWCSPYWLMIAIQFVTSFFGGAIDTAGNAELVRIWGKDGEMAMQFIHFGFALGGVISPLVTEPFLTPIPDDDADHLTTASPLTTTTNSSNFSSTAQVLAPDNSTLPEPLTTDVHYAFLISGGIILVIAIPLTAQLFSDRSQKRRQDEKDEKQDVKQPLPLALFLLVQGLLCMLYLLYCGMEDMYASFLMTFVVKQLHWSKSSGARLTSLFWASFASGRFLCIFVVRMLSCVKLLASSCLSLCVAMLCVLFFSAHDVNVGMWVATVLAGVTMAPIFPSGFTWMEMELVRVTGRVSSSILIGSSGGMMGFAVLIGFLMQEVTPMWFAYLLTLLSALTAANFFFLLGLSRLYLRQHYSTDRQKTVTQERFVSTLNAEDKSSTV